MNTDEIELTPSSRGDTPSYANSITDLNDAGIDSSKLTSSLPPVDRGRQAYLFIASATVIEILVWGLPFSVGILQEYWTSVLFPVGTPNRQYIALAATLQTGLMYCSGVVFTPLISNYPRQRMYLQSFGLVCSVVGIVGSGFATKPIHLVLTLGIIYPFSGLLYFPCCGLLFEWFYERRGLASGIMYCGTGAGGAMFPFIMQGLLQKLGYRMAMIVLGLGYGIAGGIALISIIPRIPVPARGTTTTRTRRINYSFLKSSTFYAFSGAIFFTSLGNFLPSVYLPSFATDLGLSNSDGVLLISLMNIASIPGLLLLGYLSDRIHIRYVIAFSCLGSALSCLFLWGFAKDLKILTIFAIVFGVTGLSFASVWTKLITIISADDPTLPPLIMSLFAFWRGIGNISSGPVSTSLLSYSSLREGAGGYGVKNYGPLLLYTGLTIFVGSIVGISYRTPRKRET